MVAGQFLTSGSGTADLCAEGSFLVRTTVRVSEILANHPPSAATVLAIETASCEDVAARNVTENSCFPVSSFINLRKSAVLESRRNQ